MPLSAINPFWEKREVFQSLALLLIVVGSLFSNLGAAPLFDEDEGVYAEVTREMVASRDWLTPRLNGKQFFHKPPMVYWCQAVSVYFFGLNEFALRLPSAFASALWAALLFFFIRYAVGFSAAWYATILLVTSIQTHLIAKAALADALLNLFLAATMIGVYAYFQKPTLVRLTLTYLCMALGLLTKGPIAVLIPLAVSGIYYAVMQRDWKRWLQAIFHPAGWAVLVVVAAPWHIMMGLEHGGAFWNELITKHNIVRFQGAMEGHSGPIFYYLPVIIAGMLPHSALVLVAGRRVRELVQRPVNRYFAVWFLFVLVFFSLAATKLPHYIVYGYVPLFAFMGQVAARIHRPLGYMAWPIGFIAVMLFLPPIAQLVAGHLQDPFARQVITEGLLSLGGFYLTATVFCLFFYIALAAVNIRPMIRIGLTGIIMVLYVSFVCVPVAGRIMQQPIQDAALMAKARGYQVTMWKMSYPSFNVYLEQQDLDRPIRSGDVIITKTTKLDHIRDYEILFQENGIVLVRVIALN